MYYYYVLKQGFTPEEKADTVHWLNKLGLTRFASGLMWLLHEVFGLEADEAHQLLPPNEKEGRFLLHEILLTGNMGHTDPRPWGSRKTPLKRFLHNLRRDFYLLGHYPQEVLWQPVFSIWLYVWRLRKDLLRERK